MQRGVAVSLFRLLEGILPAERLAGLPDLPIRRICDDSRRVEPGDLFVAIPGTRADGAQFVGDAVRRGAAAVIVQRPVRCDAPVPVIAADDARETLARLAWRQAGLERDADASAGGLRLVGITGTNGKTTTAYFVQAIASAAGLPCARLGTVENDLCGRCVPASLTTPGPLELAALLAEARQRGARLAVLEVSSHALEQRRVAGLTFSAAALTNLTQDHLDYHGTMEAYAAAKRRLFAGLAAEAAAVCVAGDPWAGRVLAGCAARRIEVGLGDGLAVRGEIHETTLDGTRWTLHVGAERAEVHTPLIGRHNVANALVAAGLALGLGFETDTIAAGLASLRRVPGRLERIDLPTGVRAFVDYAHTPDALHHVVQTLRPLTSGRLVVVFGCGGDRDRTKRPRMTQAVLSAADVAILTSDNPRSEDPQRIIADALAGLTPAQRRRVVIEPDRRCAIRAAIGGASDGDVVLVAGKGHEREQIVGTQRLPFDDAQEIRDAAAMLSGVRAGSRS